MRTLVWFRGKDLRVSDHAPLVEAVRAGEVVPLFVLDPFFFAPARARELPHRMQFLRESLVALEQNIAHLGSRLVVVAGRAVDEVPKLAARWKVDRVVAHRWVEPFGRERDRQVAEALGDVPFELHEGETLAPPDALRTGDGEAYGVYTPFAKAFRARIAVAAPLPAPRKLPPLPDDVATRSVAIPTLAELGISENPRLQRGGERAARARLKVFLDGPAGRTYDVDRDRMDRDGTSRLSADLKFGTLSARAIWTAAAAELRGAPRDKFLAEVLWREFSHATLWARPDLLTHTYKPAWEGFPWRDDRAGWDAWVAGKTGYPVVDAAARQLLAEGYVHNRARMVAASFLTKHLLIDFRRGEAHYLKWLTDGDWAQNDLGWQWSTGCGVDAQPWFRIFNPTLQANRFDPDGVYVKTWVPEVGTAAYPAPIVDHDEARQRFLAVAKRHLG